MRISMYVYSVELLLMCIDLNVMQLLLSECICCLLCLFCLAHVESSLRYYCCYLFIIYISMLFFFDGVGLVQRDFLLLAHASISQSNLRPKYQKHYRISKFLIWFYLSILAFMLLRLFFAYYDSFVGNCCFIKIKFINLFNGLVDRKLCEF